MGKATIPSFKKATALIRQSVERVIVPAIEDTLEHEREGFQRFIRQQRFPAARMIPLSANWLGRKRALGLDLRTLISTGTYVRNIRVFHRRDRALRMRSWRVDLPPTMHARTPEGRISPITLQELAAIQEYGTTRVPARPHWRPYWMAAGRRVRTSVANANLRAVRSINRDLRKGR